MTRKTIWSVGILSCTLAILAKAQVWERSTAYMRDLLAADRAMDRQEQAALNQIHVKAGKFRAFADNGQIFADFCKRKPLKTRAPLSSSLPTLTAEKALGIKFTRQDILFWEQLRSAEGRYYERGASKLCPADTVAVGILDGKVTSRFDADYSVSYP